MVAVHGLDRAGLLPDLGAGRLVTVTGVEARVGCEDPEANGAPTITGTTYRYKSSLLGNADWSSKV